MQKGKQGILSQHGLISFWDFQEGPGNDRVAQGPYAYRLKEMNGPIARAEEGVFGPYSAVLDNEKWMNCPRVECPALNIHGEQAEVTVAAWVKRADVPSQGCEAVAGIWNETEKKRQYCLFINLSIWDSAEQVCGHVSAVGGPTPGYKYSMSSSIGSTPVTKGKWHFIAFTYDGKEAKSYLDGVLDRRETYNPYAYTGGLFDGGENGADFTVGAVNRSNEIGNFYKGLLGGLAVFNRALTSEEIASIHESV